MTDECRNCTLPADHPLAHLDATGTCRPCRSFERWSTNPSQHREASEELSLLLQTTRGPDSIDAVVAVSGGKDSCWTLYELARQTSLRLHAVTIDNGFLSQSALDNARRVAEVAGATHEIFAPPVEDMRQLFRVAAETELHPETSQGRASSICNACISVIKLYCLHVAQRERAPLLAWGWSPGQAPLSSALYQPTASMLKVFVARQRDPLLNVFPRATEWIFEPSFDINDTIPRFVHPLAIWNYNESSIIEHLLEIGWTRPHDVDVTSTNCRLNALGVAIHQRRYGYHPYAHEMAGLVRVEAMTVEESRLRQKPLEVTPEILAIAEELGLSPNIFG
jgi:hypothetical protein